MGAPLILSLWLVLPAYALYAASCADPSGPSEWLVASASWLAVHWPFALGGAFLAVIASRRRSAVAVLQMAAAAAAIAVVVAALASMAVIPKSQPATSISAFPLWFGRQLGAYLSGPVVAGEFLLLGIPLLWIQSGTDPKQRLRSVTLALVGLFIVGSGCGVLQLLFDSPWGSHLRHGSIWISRYLGIVWPAFAIGLCLLLTRQPTRLLRGLGVFLLLAVNVAQSTAMFIADPLPTQRVTQDLLAGSSNPGSVRTLILDPSLRGELYPQVLSYYASLASGRPVGRPREMLSGGAGARLSSEGHLDTSLDALPDLRQNDGASNLIVWRTGGPIDPAHDDILRAIGAQWERRSQVSFTLRSYYDRWRWSSLGTATRCEYVRRKR